MFSKQHRTEPEESPDIKTKNKMKKDLHTKQLKPMSDFERIFYFQYLFLITTQVITNKISIEKANEILEQIYKTIFI
jgi:hypothetical protein